jgi:hypothetical protein
MAAKKRKRGADALAEKEKKQKKVAAILLVVLLAAMAFSIPKTMKMLNQQSAAATPPPVATTTAPVEGATPAPTGVDAGAAAVAAAGTPTLVTAETGGVAGQLISFERFPTKDPFVQQVGAVVPKKDGGPVAATGATGATGVGGPSGVTAKPGAGTDGEAPGETAVPGSTGSGSSGGSGGGSTVTPAPGPVTTDPTSAMISVNGGVPQAVAVEGTFPTADPMFEVVELLPTGAKIAIVDGGYQSGAETITLTVGIPLTLQNTTDGTRYEILLVSLG